jgi:FMN phosphatase YigB (HAD superfamily)
MAPPPTARVTDTRGNDRAAAADDGKSVIFFDIDNCLYSRKSGIEHMMGTKIRGMSDLSVQGTRGNGGGDGRRARSERVRGIDGEESNGAETDGLLFLRRVAYFKTIGIPADEAERLHKASFDFRYNNLDELCGLCS